MKITVKYIHNTQAIRVKAVKGLKEWNTYWHNCQKFAYNNARGNGMFIRRHSQEEIEAMRGQY